jgi:hypothetical protein
MSYEREKEKGKRPDVTVQAKMGKGGMAGGKRLQKRLCLKRKCKVECK